MDEATALAGVRRPRVNPYSVWSIVNAVRMILVVSGLFALAGSAYSIVARRSDDAVLVAATLFAAFTVCVAGTAIVAGLHRVYLAVHTLGEQFNDATSGPV